jgi:gamma-glutamylcyclotransferase (GGCT)/AIG2-like uncharacterized protein YtfP
MFETKRRPRTRLFAYGTLMEPEVLQGILGRTLPCLPATLADHRRCRVPGEDYPALIPAPGETCSGLLLSGLGNEDWRRLDAYEGLCYIREPVLVRVASGEVFSCQVYRWKLEYRDLLTDREWRP